jgi:soluble lytic murein transglycosylase
VSTRTAAHRTRSRAAPAPPRRTPVRRRRRQVVRRRIAFLLAVALGGLAIALAIAPWADQAVQEVTLPLRHDDIIRQQAADKDLDPALIAAVIFTESHFRDQTSQAGAKGLMQLMPQTAAYIAEKSGGTAFVQGDLATPQVNIAYGSWYLRHLLDKYDGRVALTLAAYNAGQGNVDAWLAEAGARGERFSAAAHIPFPETRDYVRKVLEAREDYRREYARELGL